MVTSSLPDPEALSAEEIIAANQKVDPEILREQIIQARGLLRDGRRDVWECVSKMSAYQTTSGFFGSKRLNVLLLLHAHAASRGDRDSVEWLEDALERAEDEIDSIIERKHRENRVGTFTSSVDFLGEILEEDLVAFLADITGSSTSAARRWSLGGRARRRSAFTVYSVAQALFAFYKKEGRQSVQEWMYQPLSSGRAPRELWVHFGNRMDPELGEELRRLELL